ncbi:MupG family TIM beta-alpha barrel fold protein [Staphylococcus auricularis]|uniref:MupG family TIM beta-alpha barrel fold protein n=1 Tax=Staphylococcus auricularis TaxID=29379 RepID=UPI003EB90B99
MHGFSVYLGTPLNQSYIREMIDLGFTTIFTSLQIPEDNAAGVYDRLDTLVNLCDDSNITMMLDVNPSLLNQRFYSLFNNDSNLRYVLRIDNDTSVQVVNRILEAGFSCCLNASTIDTSLLQALVRHTKYFKHLIYCHNYYPRPDTGISESHMSAQNQLIRSFNSDAQIFGFIPGTTYRGTLFKGLPSLESVRYVHPIVAAQRLQDCGTTHILVGDPELAHHHAKGLSAMLQQRHFDLHIELYTLDKIETSIRSILEPMHTVRPDLAAKVIRSAEARRFCSHHITPSHTTLRKKGDITIDNTRNGRYEGELQLIKAELPAHPHVNVVGRIQPHELDIIDCLRPNDTFRLIQAMGE